MYVRELNPFGFFKWPLNNQVEKASFKGSIPTQVLGFDYEIVYSPSQTYWAS
jgi:hypothetical protein